LPENNVGNTVATRLRMSSLSSMQDMLETAYAAVVQYMFISHKQHSCTDFLYDGLGTSTQGWLEYVHKFNQNSIAMQ